MKLALNGFQKVSKNGNMTTLRHPSGHELNINHSILSPKMRGDIEALPHVSEKHPDSSVQKFAEGTPDEPVREDQEADKRITEQNERADKDESEKASAEKERSDSAIEQETAKSPQTVLAQANNEPTPNTGPSDMSKLIDAHHKLVSALGPQSSDQGQMVQPVTTQDQQAAGLPQTSQQPDSVPQATDTTPTQGTDQQDAAPSSSDTTPATPNAPAQPAVPGQTPVAQASGTGYQSNANAASQNVNNLATYTAQQEAKNQTLHDEIIKGKIDPTKYFHNLSTVGKVTSVIGLILGGLGAGGTGGKNLAVGTINDAIERDVDAQKANMSQGNNLYKMNLEATKNGQEARAMTINQQLTMAQAALTKQAAGTTNQQALMNLQKTQQDINKLKLENDMSAYKAKILSGLDTNQQPQAPGTINQSRFNPLVLSGVMPKEDATAATKEAQNYQEGQKLKANMEESAKHLDNQIGAGIFTPSDRQSAVNSFAGRIAKIAEGRFNLEESKLQAQALLPSPGDLPSTVRNKTQRRAEFFDSLTPTTTLERYGLKAPSKTTTPIKTMNGVPYQLGADGQYHKVK